MCGEQADWTQSGSKTEEGERRERRPKDCQQQDCHPPLGSRSQMQRRGAAQCPLGSPGLEDSQEKNRLRERANTLSMRPCDTYLAEMFRAELRFRVTHGAGTKS